MFSPDQYELIDFGSVNGQGYKLERFQGHLVSRPCPAADKLKIKEEGVWQPCDSWFSIGKNRAEKGGVENVRGKWKHERQPPEPWVIKHGLVSFQLKPTPFGHLGVFAEQQTNWEWIYRQVQSASKTLKVLNLFGYTGGSTLAAATGGAEVVHIDSAKNVVQWARENARLSDLQDHPVRWIVEDSGLFVEREVKRGNRYDAIILDPPSFGHGPKGEIWKIERDLLKLLRQCRQLLTDSPAFVLLTAHSPGLGPAELQAMLCDAIFGTCSTQVASRPLSVATANGRQLNAGNMVRWPR